MSSMLAQLLHRANADPPMTCKREFYLLKEQLLGRYAKRDGDDVQYIPGKPCWGCDGTGESDYLDPQTDEYDICHRCGGDGLYKSPRWVTLHRWDWDGFIFHTIGAATYRQPEQPKVTIHGFVQHVDYGRRSATAFATLCLLCGQWKLLGRWLISSRACGWQWHPWLILQQICMEIRLKVDDYRRRCNYCGRHTWGSCTFICSRCDREREQRWQKQRDEGVPF